MAYTQDEQNAENAAHQAAQRANQAKWGAGVKQVSNREQQRTAPSGSSGGCLIFVVAILSLVGSGFYSLFEVL